MKVRLTKQNWSKYLAKRPSYTLKAKVIMSYISSDFTFHCLIFIYTSKFKETKQKVVLFSISHVLQYQWCSNKT